MPPAFFHNQFSRTTSSFECLDHSLRLLQRNQRVGIAMDKQKWRRHSFHQSGWRKLLGALRNFFFRVSLCSAHEKQVSDQRRIGRFSVPVQKIRGGFLSADGFSG